MHIVSKDVDYVWVDIACIIQGQSEDVNERMDQIGKQMGMVSEAFRAYVWLSCSSEVHLKSLDEVHGHGLELTEKLRLLRTAKEISDKKEQGIFDLLELSIQVSRSFRSDP